MTNRILVNRTLLPGCVVVCTRDQRGQLLSYTIHPAPVFDGHTKQTYREWLDARDPEPPQLRLVRGGA